MAHYGKLGNYYGKLGNNNTNQLVKEKGNKIPAYSMAYSSAYAHFEPKK